MNKYFKILKSAIKNLHQENLELSFKQFSEVLSNGDVNQKIIARIYIKRMTALGEGTEKNEQHAHIMIQSLLRENLSGYHLILFKYQIAVLHFKKAKDSSKLNDITSYKKSFQLIYDCSVNLKNLYNQKIISDPTNLITYSDLLSKIQLHKAKIYSLKNIYTEYKVDDEIRRWNEIISIANEPYIQAKAKLGLCKVAIEIFMKGNNTRLDIKNIIKDGMDLIKTYKKEHTLKCKFKHLSIVYQQLTSGFPYSIQDMNHQNGSTSIQPHSVLSKKI